jgi:DNA-binding MarR family transcriptional regulator
VVKNKVRSQTGTIKSPAISDDQKPHEKFIAPAKRILQVDDFFIDMKQGSTLRPDARLLLFIIVKQSASIKEAMLDSALSYRAFYTMLDRLKRLALIDVVNDDADRRVRKLVIGQQFDTLMAKMEPFKECRWGKL